jgi:hypothetical protein
MVIENAVEIQREYLNAVLLWLNARLEYQINRWQLAGQDPADRFRGLRISDAEALSLARRSPATSWGSTVAAAEKDEKRYEDMLISAEKQIHRIEAEAREQGISLRLKSLETVFGLSTFEWWAFIICLAPALDLRYERIYGYLQDDVTRVKPAVDLILFLLLPEGLDRLDSLACFERHAPLRQFRLILPGEDNSQQTNTLSQAFQAAPAVVSWILGTYTQQTDDPKFEFHPLSSSVLDEWAASIFDTASIPSPEVFNEIHPLVSFYGDDLLQQDLSIGRLAAALNKPYLKVNLSSETGAESALEHLYPAVRDARMLGALLYIEGADVFIGKEGTLSPEAFEVLQLFNDSIFLSSKNTFRLAEDMPGNDYPLMHVHLEKPSTSERANLWSSLLEGASDQISQTTLQSLAGQFVLTTGQIVAAASTAMSQALQEGRQLSSSDLFEAARLHSGSHLGGLAHKIEPRYHWEDLVLPETPVTMLHELVGMVKSRPRVLEEWGLGRKLTSSLGVSALFTGPPGTGKTLAAQIIANELGIDLYRIDLSTIVSKYVGETEKNLEKIFNEAQTSNAILFFDEADSIFGKRSEVKDAQDRYANIEVGYLLQRMEAYDGIAILATNLRANLDEAFTRRLQFIINFPFPEEEHRQRIWEVLLPPQLPRAADLDLKLMASRFKLAGGSIRNCIVSAAFIAAEDHAPHEDHCCVKMTHLMHGVRRELQKMGRLIQESDFVLPQDQRGE